MLATMTATLAVNAYIILHLILFVKCFLLLFEIVCTVEQLWLDNQDAGHKPNKKSEQTLPKTTKGKEKPARSLAKSEYKMLIKTAGIVKKQLKDQNKLLNDGNQPKKSPAETMMDFKQRGQASKRQAG